MNAADVGLVNDARRGRLDGDGVVQHRRGPHGLPDAIADDASGDVDPAVREQLQRLCLAEAIATSDHLAPLRKSRGVEFR